MVALRQLRDEGLLEFRRGRGISVVAAPDRSVVLQRAHELVGRRHGYDFDQIAEIRRSIA